MLKMVKILVFRSKLFSIMLKMINIGVLRSTLFSFMFKNGQNVGFQVKIVQLYIQNCQNCSVLHSKLSKLGVKGQYCSVLH